MKKSVRRLLIAGVVLVVVVLLVGVLALNSGVQTWAARKALAGQPGPKGTLGEVAIGFQSVVLNNLELEQAGAVIMLPSLTAELSVVDACLNQKISLRRLVAKGWTLDLTAYKFPDTAVKPSPAVASVSASAEVAVRVFQGVFAQAALPFDLTVDGVELEGDVRLPPAPGMTAGRAHVVLKGGGLSSGREGTFVFDLAVELKGDEVPVNALKISGRFIAAMDTPRTFARLATQVEAAATGAQFPNGVKLAADLAAARASTGESYAISLSDGARLLAGLKAELPLGSRHLSGTWKLDLRDTDLSPFALGRSLPLFTLAGAGGLDVETTTSEVQATGTLVASADKLGVVQAELASLGPVKLTAEFDVARRGDSLRVERLRAAFAGVQPVASVQSLQPFEFNPQSGELKVADPTSDLLGLALHSLPLAWVQPFLKDVAFSGTDLRGELVAKARGGGFSLRSKSPLTVAGVSLAQVGKPIFNGVDMSLTAAFDYTPQGWQAEVSPLTATSGSAGVLTLEGKVGQLRGEGQPIKSTGRFSINLSEALRQPALAGKITLTAGTAAGDFIVSLAAKSEIQANVALTNLASDAETSQQKLPSLSAGLRVDISADRVLSLRVPLIIERDGRKSDLTLAGTATPEKSSLVVDARVTSERFVIDDAQVLSALLTVTPPPATVGAVTLPRASAPPWAGISGQVQLALKQVVYSDTFQVSDLAGIISLEAGSAKLVNFRAGLGDGAEAEVSGALTFDAKSVTPYALAANLALHEFNPGSLLRTFSPGQPATVEGKFAVASQLVGRAASLGDLAASTHGDFQLASKGGVFRGLPMSYSAKVETAGKIAAGAAAIGSILGSVTGKKDIADIANKAQAVAEISKTLTAIPYDQLNLVFTRDEAMNTTLKDFSLIAPELRLSGGGQIMAQPGTGLLEQSLTMEFRLRARGRTADLLKYLGKLDVTTDELGYAPCTLPLNVTGTLARPDTTELNQAMAALALEKSGVTERASELFNKLIGGGK